MMQLTKEEKSTRKSLNFSMTLTSGMLLWSIYNLSFYILKDINGDLVNMPYVIFVVATCLLYPLMRTQIKVTKEVNIETKNTYNLKFFK